MGKNIFSIEQQNNKWIKIYLAGAMSQMLVACLITGLLRAVFIDYPPVINAILLIFGGASTAFWGGYIALKSGKVSSIFAILKDFFNVKQNIYCYGIVFFFLAINFGYSLITGKFLEYVKWYSFFLFFARAIILGGIEEVGWRYSFQPLVEKKLPFEVASIITFVCWGIWHYMFFYLSDTMQLVNHTTFLVCLLGSCFVLGAVYKISSSLWLCVLYHCLLNAFSQTLQASNLCITILSNSICVVCAVCIVRIVKFPRKNRTKQE